MQLQREQLMPGVALTTAPAESFKRCRISLNFILRGERETATAYALLPMVMERGYAGCPDMTRLSRRLARLYGAGLSVSGGTQGPNRVVTVGVSGIRNEYAIGGEDLLGAYLELLFGMAFDPDVHDGTFDAEAVRIEKDKLYELQESEINDKRLYCLRQARRRFYGDDVGGLERYGYTEDVAGITPQQLYTLWQRMVQTARLEVVALGVPTQPIAQRLRDALQPLRRPAALNRPHLMPLRPAMHCDEPISAVQGKLCLLFTMDAPLPVEQLSQMRLAVAMLGGTPTSRLFMNVREKQSLCYYCTASYSQIAGCMSIDSGVAFENAARAEAAILAELDALIHGPIPAEELEDARRYLCCALEGVQDNLPVIENWLLGEISRDTLYTPQQVIGQLQAVTEQQVRDMLQKFSLSVVYTLTDGGQGGEAQ